MRRGAFISAAAAAFFPTMRLAYIIISGDMFMCDKYV